jgi:alpha-galactosidase
LGFEAIAEVSVDPRRPATVYAEGWQSWSPIRLHRTGEESERAPDERAQTVGWRPGKPVPEGVIQGEGVLALASDDAEARAWYSPDPGHEVATLRLRGGEVTADGPVEEVRAPDLAAALATVGERLGPPHLALIPAGWSSWSCYFKHVADADVIENVEAARQLELPVEIAQLDDGYEAAIGDWLDARPGFGSLSRLGERIREAGMRAGIWTAPFMVDPESRLAAEHPDWLVQDVDAGLHWGRRMRILDVGYPAAAQHLAEVFRTLAAWGFTYHKLDFLYAGAIPGLAAYREGMGLIRDALGPGATVLACGAPLLPTIGLCDAMRIGPDVLPETSDPQPDVESLTRITGLRSWMNGRLWVNDPDHLVARREIKERQRWAAYVGDYGGVRFSGDRLGELDELGLELTRQVLSNPAR